MFQEARGNAIPITQTTQAADAFGYFEQTGPRVSLEEELGWGSIRERILYGELDAAHAPGGPLFSILLGIEAPPRSVQTDLVLNLQGNAITLSRRVWQKGVFLEGCCLQLPGVEINAATEVKGVANNRPRSLGRILCVFQSPEGRIENSPGRQPWEPHA
ncbi:MAG: ABC transporter substrate-binding protein, partial [Verrucomicrobia bacterium]|nr:ABC transporter substrate-binding protein [Verrucomicrobiota bacterium]